MKMIILFISLIFPVITLGKAQNDLMPKIPKSFRANFEQRIKSTLTNKIKKSIGKMAYHYPKRLRFEVTRPDYLLLVSNEEKAVKYVPPFIEGEKEDIKWIKSKDLPVLQLLDLMAGQKKGQKFFTSKVDKKNKRVELIFNKKKVEQLRIKKTILSFKSGLEFKNIDFMTIVYADNKAVNIYFSNVEANIKLPDQTFIFKNPSKSKKK